MRMAFCSALLAGAISASPLYADNIQMLPPTDFNGAPCSSTTGGLLQWDGQTSVKCVPGVSGDPNGNIGIGTSTPQVSLDVSGQIRPGSTGVQVGKNCTAEGSFGYDSTSTTHQPLYCNDKLVWTALGGGQWVDEDLYSTEPFDLNCSYRIKPAADCSSAFSAGFGKSNEYYTVLQLITTSIEAKNDIYDLAIWSINRKKIRIWIDQVPNFAWCDAAAIQKLCGG